jgi:hypothetical protein
MQWRIVALASEAINRSDSFLWFIVIGNTAVLKS